MVGQAPRLPREHAFQRQAGHLPYKQKRGLPNRATLYSPRRQWDERFRRAWGECRWACARWFAGEVAEEAGKRPDKLDRQLEDVLGLLHERTQPVDQADQGPGHPPGGWKKSG